MDVSEQDPRARFFNESDDSLPPFRRTGWRGCVLDRDRFDHTRLPKFLFESITTAARTTDLLLHLYTPDRPDSVSLSPDWDSFRSFVYEPDNWSLEYVLYDNSGSWAVLADPDVVVVGAEPELADNIDALLDQHGTSLKRLTHADFPGMDSGGQNWHYFSAVVGSQVC